MKVLIACERSGVIRKAFRDRGHDAWSCDLQPDATGSVYHYQCDILDLIAKTGAPYWELIIAHPSCQYLANSGVHCLWRASGGMDGDRMNKMKEAAEFFRYFLNLDCPRICVENPVIHGYARKIIGRNFTQSIQPYQFGDDASKRTCLWLKGLPTLEPTQYIAPRIVQGKKRWANQTDGGQNKLGPSPDRPDKRAQTYRGIAAAMAEQWGNNWPPRGLQP